MTIIATKELLWNNVDQWTTRAKMIIRAEQIFGRNLASVIDKIVRLSARSKEYVGEIIRSNHTYIRGI